MPARLGELFRAEFFKTTFGLSRSWGLSSIVIERLFDGMTVICCSVLARCSLRRRGGTRACFSICCLPAPGYSP
jgi:hypothetical protein